MSFFDSIIGFRREEFECKCGCGFNAVDVELLSVLLNVKQHYSRLLGEEVHLLINSGCRCVEHNEVIQKKASQSYIAYTSKSAHIRGTAADFVVKGVHADEVADYLEKTYPDKYGIGRYKGRTHLDIRSTKARWDSR